jgi:CRP/FNR family transcriptional regulator
MTTWMQALPVSDRALQRLAALVPRTLPRGTVIFHPGDEANGFVVLLSGLIEVYLTGPSGREILLYTVEPGQSCIQTTLGMMTAEAYTGEAHIAADATVITIPKPLFAALMDEEPAFRSFVMKAFARRMSDVTRLLEQVAFGRIEARLAAALLELAEDGLVHATQGELAARIGSAREVVSRRLEAFQRQGWVETDRGQVRLADIPALKAILSAPL